MGNVLKDEKKQQIIALGRLGWSLRKIQETTRVRRETISAYLRGAGVEIWPPGRWKREGKAKPAIPVITGSEAAKPAIPESGGQPNFNPNPNRENLSTKGKAKATSKPAIEVITGFGVGLSGREPENSSGAGSASSCEPYREIIELGLSRDRNAMAIWQDLVSDHGFQGGYQSVRFLDGPGTSIVTWHQKYNQLRNFFLFWVARDAMRAAPIPPPRSPILSTFVPYIYSRTQIRLLLASVRASQKHDACQIDAQTLRSLLLFLYGTGALVGEACRMRREDMNFEKRLMTIRSNRFSRSREVPIGPDLYKVLHRHHIISLRKGEIRAPQFFLNKQGNALNERTLGGTFQRLRRIAGVARHDGALYQPRLHDFRHTFAVHRLSAWIKHDADLNRMIPALSAYIGQVGLGSTYRYLHMTPERFRAQLDKLSPVRGKRHWRDNPALMRFLAEL